MNTNWPDVFVVLIWCLTLLLGMGLSGWLAYNNHPWFALAVLMLTASIRVKTGT